jgi:hypothetical protein
VNRTANRLTGAGVADTTGALLNEGGGDGPYVAQFALGTRLSYNDRNGDRVSLSLRGGGLLELRRGGDGEAQQLRLINVASGRSTLQGQVRRAGKDSDGRTALPSILGTAGVKLRLKSFAVGTISPSDDGANVPSKASHGRTIKHHVRRHRHR